MAVNRKSWTIFFFLIIIVSTSCSKQLNGFDRDPGLDGLDEKNLCREYLEKASQISYGDLKARHTEDFSSIFNRVSIDLGDGAFSKPTRERIRDFGDGADDKDLIALYFQYGRYLLMSSFRPGGIPANLQGYGMSISAPRGAAITPPTSMQR